MWAPEFHEHVCRTDIPESGRYRCAGDGDAQTARSARGDRAGTLFLVTGATAHGIYTYMYVYVYIFRRYRRA